MLNYQNIRDRAIIHNYFETKPKKPTRWERVKKWFLKTLRYVKLHKRKR